VTLRQHFDLYAMSARADDGRVPSRFTGIDLVIVRENTEDLYRGDRALHRSAAHRRRVDRIISGSAASA